LRARRILLDCSATEFRRIFVHEVFHFVWPRLGNPARWSYEDLLRGEWSSGARGELGWSAEWRKRSLSRANGVPPRNRPWREYCCESFCDTAAWLYSGVKEHEEFTLAACFRQRRQEWITALAGRGPLSI